MYRFKSRFTLRLLTAIAALLAAAIPATAQQGDTAIVVGTVVDTSRAPVPGATVTLTHLATSAVSETVSNERGEYRTAPVRIGVYEMRVELEGFKRFVRTGIVLNLGDTTAVNAVLEIGDLAETVTVEAATPLLRTADSTISTVITNQQIKDLPLNGRDYLQLAAISAGTTVVPGVGISIGGQAGSQVAFLLDGQDNNNQQIATSHSNQKEIIKPSVDAIQEFKVVTNGYSAEYGRSSSGVVSVSLKSGTNDLHGTVYEFVRNAALDAKNVFATEKAPFSRNQFGAAAGFPIVRNRTFAFADFEVGRIRQSTTVVSTVPSAAQRAGQFANTIIDPLTRQPFPGNRIPADRFDPASLRVLESVTLPQTGAAANNFVYNSPRDQNPRAGDVRIDHLISSNENVYVRYSFQGRNDGVAQDLPPDANGNYYSGAGAEENQNHAWVVVHNRVWSPNVISAVRVGYNSTEWNRYLPDQPLVGIGLPGIPNPTPSLPRIDISGYRTLGLTSFVPNYDDSKNRQISGDLTWTRGAHAIKTGVQAYWMQINFISGQSSGGQFNFNGQYTRDPFADFLLGYVSQATYSTPAQMNFRTTYAHLFVQDDWRVTSNLTLNLGLRYERNPPFYDANDAISNFDMDSNPAAPRFVLAGEEGSDWTSRSLQGVDNRQFAPRVGFAYSLGNRTVVRGGYGIFYSNAITLGGASSLQINPPFSVRVVQITDRAAPPSLIFSQGFPDDALDPANANNLNPISYDRRVSSPHAHQWNVNVQRELAGGVVVDLGYTANRFVNNWRMIDGNPAPPGAGSVNGRRPFTSTIIPGETQPVSISSVLRVQKDGWSRYRALQAKVEKRYSRGVSLLASYAYSRTTALGDNEQDASNPAAEIAIADTDRPHYFVGSGLLELPFGRGHRFGNEWGGVSEAFLGGWSVSPIVSAMSGLPVNLSVVGNPSNTGRADRPNLVGDPDIDERTAARWFNTAAFVPNAPFTFGDTPRNFLRGPARFTVDVVLRKSFRLSDRVTADLRFESFNVTNHTNLRAPNAQVGSPAFGTITEAEAARSNQIAVKLAF